MRQAWKAVCDAARESETRKRRGLDESDDVPLPSPQLAELSEQFFARYKMAYPAECEPSEALVSKISRELGRRVPLHAEGVTASRARPPMVGRRQVTMMSVWKVRTLLNAARAARKRQRIGDVEFVCDEKDDPDPAKDLKTYIALHQVLMVACARAGVKPIDPAPGTPEKASSDTTDFVQIPLDVAMAYHFRLVKYASAMPFSIALPNVVRRDEEERAWWTDRVRTSELSVGKIIREGLQTREVMWSPPSPPAPGPQRPPTSVGRSQRTGGKGAQLGDRLKDGTQVCRKFNAGECSEPCPRGYKRVCSVVINKTGRCFGVRGLVPFLPGVGAKHGHACAF